MPMRQFRPATSRSPAPTSAISTCPHCCVPIEWPDRLDIDVALRFLEDAHAYGIRTLGFTGGEPFLYPEFVVALTRRGAELGFRFDKIDDQRRLASATSSTWSKRLTDLRDAGFTGKLGLSVDKFHGTKHTAKLAEFCRTARRVFDRDNIVSLSYASRAPDQGLEPIQRAGRRNSTPSSTGPTLLGRYLLVTPDLTMTLNWNHLAPVERAEKLAGGWDGDWFEEDYCEGPGQALDRQPKGEVKPCCGFASDLDQLTIGNIHTDTVAQDRRASAASTPTSARSSAKA